MTKSFSASIKDFAGKTERKMRQIMQDATFDLLEAAQTPQLGVTKGATGYVEGKIPVAESDLIRSLVSELNGSPVGEASETSYQLSIAQMEIGDLARFAWTSDHALPMELGYRTASGTEVGGRHFVSANAARWQQIVDENVARVASQ